MFARRWRSGLIALIAIVAIWATALTVYFTSKNARPTAAKIAQFVDSIDLSKLSPDERAKALKSLADQINGLSIEERRKARVEQAGMRWFQQMSEAEKGEFIERTMPNGFKQMLTAFEQMSEDKRRRSVDDALKRLREVQGRLAFGGRPGTDGGTNGAVLSPELEAKIRTIGLKAFYSQSSAQTKAELAPVLEELQRVMETGRNYHRH